MSLDYSSLLTKAWNITWKYKVLWFFGFLAALGGAGWGGSSGGGGSPSFNFKFGSSSSSSSSIYRNGDYPPAMRATIDKINSIDLSSILAIAFGVVCVLAILGLALWLLSIVGRGGLIGGILKAEADEKITFRETWNTGTHYFLPLLLIRLLGIAVGIIISIVVGLPLVFLGILTCGIGLIPMVCLMFVIGIAINVWFAFMDYAVVVENLGVGTAIGRAWTVLRDHVGPVFILWIVLFAISLGVGLGMVILFAPSGVLLFLSVLPLIQATGSLNGTLLVAGIVLLVLFVLASWLVQAVVTVWETGVMVLAYKKLSGETPFLAVRIQGPPPVAAS